MKLDEVYESTFYVDIYLLPNSAEKETQFILISSDLTLTQFAPFFFLINIAAPLNLFYELLCFFVFCFFVIHKILLCLISKHTNIKVGCCLRKWTQSVRIMNETICILLHNNYLRKNQNPHLLSLTMGIWQGRLGSFTLERQFFTTKKLWLQTR